MALCCGGGVRPGPFVAYGPAVHAAGGAGGRGSVAEVRGFRQRVGGRPVRVGRARCMGCGAARGRVPLYPHGEKAFLEQQPMPRVRDPCSRAPSRTPRAREGYCTRTMSAVHLQTACFGSLLWTRLASTTLQSVNRASDILLNDHISASEYVSILKCCTQIDLMWQCH